jgi:hypothetical protein
MNATYPEPTPLSGELPFDNEQRTANTQKPSPFTPSNRRLSAVAQLHREFRK